MLNPRPNLGAASYSGAAVGKKNSSATLLKLVAGALGIGLVVEPDKERPWTSVVSVVKSAGDGSATAQSARSNMLAGRRGFSLY